MRHLLSQLEKLSAAREDFVLEGRFIAAVQASLSTLAECSVRKDFLARLLKVKRLKEVAGFDWRDGLALCSDLRRYFLVGLPVREEVDLSSFPAPTATQLLDEALLVAHHLLLPLMLLVIGTQDGPALFVLRANLGKHLSVELE